MHAVCGSTKLLLYSATPRVDQVIVDFDLQKGTFSFIDKQVTPLLNSFDRK